MSIKMLTILNARNVVSKEELANILETNVRNISEYKKELEMCGYEIEVIRGKYGGYKLNKQCLLPSLKLKESEKEVLLEASDFLNKRYDFLKKHEFQEALGKIISNTNVTTITTEQLIIDRFPLAMSSDELHRRYQIMNESITDLNKVEISYLSSKNKVKKHIIHPYKLYMYNLAWYILAFNETIHDIGYFKLNRIEELKKVHDKFRIMQTFDVNKYLDQFGMRQNGEYIDVSIELKSPYAALVRERIYGKDQQLEFVDESTTILNCKMQNEDNIVSFVLGCGAKARVLKPESIKRKVKEELEKMIKKY